MAAGNAIEVQGVWKGFQAPAPRAGTSLWAQLRHPRRLAPARRFDVLQDISFEVRRGEFFGIVGRNGSGKSTLLKLLASVYGTDRGRIRIAGRLAPFLELGVGFNPQLPAYDNVVLNGVMMGLSPDEARARYESIVDFAELGDHTDLQLKNYSSGMKVRLGFAVMTHVDADILLIDEVLAVGDAAFQEKCDVVFRRMHDEGRTIVLVTHSMPTVNSYCDRAMLIHDGSIDALGEPEEVATRYMEVNIRALSAGAGHGADFAERFADVLADPPIQVQDCWLAGSDGERTAVLPEGEPIELHALLSFDRDVQDPEFRFTIDDRQGDSLFVGSSRLDVEEGSTGRAGQRYRVRARVENQFAPGRYTVVCSATQRGAAEVRDPAARLKTIAVEVAGDSNADGLVRLRHDVTWERESEAADAEAERVLKA
ncbi:MAG: ABC transporter ATP-binding protein [Solirubrobacterales bacterium]